MRQALVVDDVLWNISQNITTSTGLSHIIYNAVPEALSRQFATGKAIRDGQTLAMMRIRTEHFPKKG